MRVLCVARHLFLTEHFCRFFGDLGAECAGTVGTTDVPRLAAEFEPHLVVTDCDLLSAALLDSWSRGTALAEVPVLAVSLTRSPAEFFPEVVCGVAAAVYLPALDRGQALALLDGAYRPRGVEVPPTCGVGALTHSVVSH